MTVAARTRRGAASEATDPLGDAAPRLAARLEELLRAMETQQQQEGARLARIAPCYAEAARNLIHYLELRRHDLRAEQEELTSLGLSSLGRCESDVRQALESVLRILRRLGDLPAPPPTEPPRGGAQALARHTCQLLGKPAEPEGASILVTLPATAATNPELVVELLEAGMTIARINAAHDEPPTWEQMVENVHRASATTGHPCRIAVDLAGPKLRTGPLQPGPAVVSAKPRRDSCGRLCEPAQILLVAVKPGQAAPASTVPGADAVIPILGEGWSALEPGTQLRGIDASGRQRSLRLRRHGPEGLWCTANHHWHFVAGLRLQVEKPRLELRVGTLPAPEGCLLLQRGDQLRLTDASELGRPAQVDAEGRILQPARIGCTLPGVFRQVGAGARIAFDDGRIGGVVRSAEAGSLLVEITTAGSRGSRLRADQGINFPDTPLDLPALTERDREVLPFVIRHADMVNLSFVQRPEDVEELHGLLARDGRPDLGVILKIETRAAFEALPALLLAAMASEAPLGVMIARGDLAIECGWERLAELQEEILRLCEAARVPCIWATQVLDALAHRGLPTRAEISDAVLGARAEGILLNKGPHITSSVRTLQGILKRMHGHQYKTRPLFRCLELATHHHPNPR